MEFLVPEDGFLFASIFAKYTKIPYAFLWKPHISAVSAYSIEEKVRENDLLTSADCAFVSSAGFSGVFRWYGFVENAEPIFFEEMI